jgi:hypothetical protein
MPELMQRRDRSGLVHPRGLDHPDVARARAFLVVGLAWASIVVAAWLFWWQIGDAGREAVAGTVGFSAVQLSPYILTSLVIEKLAAKGLLLAALFYWVKSRWADPFEKA